MVLSQLQLQCKKENKQNYKYNKPIKKSNSFYDSLYDSLFVMNEHPNIPKTRNRISVYKKAQDLLINKGFVYEISETDYNNLLKSRKKQSFTDNQPHYLISQKGHEYLKRFEALRELFNLE